MVKVKLKDFRKIILKYRYVLGKQKWPSQKYFVLQTNSDYIRSRKNVNNNIL